jgi:nucleoside-diphosphate-sugar epimerase
MRVMIIGATGTLGLAVAARLEADHEIVGLSRSSTPAVDLADPVTLHRALAAVGDHMLCCQRASDRLGR